MVFLDEDTPIASATQAANPCPQMVMEVGFTHSFIHLATNKGITSLIPMATSVTLVANSE